jgi:hypothetical protein
MLKIAFLVLNTDSSPRLERGLGITFKIVTLNAVKSLEFSRFEGAPHGQGY